MRGVRHALVVLQLLVPLHAVAAEETFTSSSTPSEPADNRCRMDFVVLNKSAAAVESMKLDFVVFGPDGGIARRLVADMGPVRPLKTIVKAFLVDTECRAIAALLVNEVVACAPGTAVGCLDGLGLSSRVKEIKLYK